MRRERKRDDKINVVYNISYISVYIHTIYYALYTSKMHIHECEYIYTIILGFRAPVKPTWQWGAAAMCLIYVHM